MKRTIVFWGVGAFFLVFAAKNLLDSPIGKAAKSLVDFFKDLLKKVGIVDFKGLSILALLSVPFLPFLLPLFVMGGAAMSLPTEEQPQDSGLKIFGKDPKTGERIQLA